MGQNNRYVMLLICLYHCLSIILWCIQVPEAEVPGDKDVDNHEEEEEELDGRREKTEGPVFRHHTRFQPNTTSILLLNVFQTFN